MSGSTRSKVRVSGLHEIDKPTCMDDLSHAGHAFSHSCARPLIEKLRKKLWVIVTPEFRRWIHVTGEQHERKTLQGERHAMGANRYFDTKKRIFVPLCQLQHKVQMMKDIAWKSLASLQIVASASTCAQRMAANLL